MKLYKEYAPVFKALSDETRLKIVEMLSCGEMCACDILESFQITQPTLSYHMKNLTESGLVKSRKDGSWMRYSLNMELLTSIQEFLNQITTESENCICHIAKENSNC